MLRVVFALFLSACATQAKPPRASAKDYYPLEPGAVWVYRATYLGQEQTRTVVMGPEQDGFFVDDQGGKLAYDGLGLRDERRYLLREPLAAGQSWSSVAALGADETYTIVSAHAPCSTASLRFEDCVEVKSTMRANGSDTLENTMVFARATGLVKLRTVLARPGARQAQVEMELVSFRASR